jgi:hypothetical protein
LSGTITPILILGKTYSAIKEVLILYGECIICS